MSADRSFWRNVTIIGVLHVAVLGGLARWTSDARKSLKPEILWLDAGAASLVSSVATAAKLPEPAATAVPEQDRTAPADDDQPALSEVKSEIQLPTPTPTATPTPTPRPTPTAAPAVAEASPVPKPSPSPKSKSSPKPTPKPSPSATPKKTLLAKAEPSPNRKVEEEKPAETPTPAATAAPADVANQPVAGSSPSDGVLSSAARPGAGKGPGGASQARSYSRMLHDRFYREWEQPTSVVAAGTKMSALVKIRIEKDGRVTGFNIVRPSGNVLVDESVAAVGRRVTQVDPLPAGVGDSYYEVKMNFELTLSQ
jgi:TonB family protein